MTTLCTKYKLKDTLPRYNTGGVVNNLLKKGSCSSEKKMQTAAMAT